MNRILTSKYLKINRLSFLTRYRPIKPFHVTTLFSSFVKKRKPTLYKANTRPIYSNLPLLLLITYAQNNERGKKGDKVPNFFGFFLLVFFIIVLGLYIKN